MKLSCVLHFQILLHENWVTVLQTDLDTLEDGQELNDAIVDFFVL